MGQELIRAPDRDLKEEIAFRAKLRGYIRDDRKHNYSQDGAVARARMECRRQKYPPAWAAEEAKHVCSGNGGDGPAQIAPPKAKIRIRPIKSATSQKPKHAKPKTAAEWKAGEPVPLGAWTKVSRIVCTSQEHAALGPMGRDLLAFLMMQYDGTNNGNLTATIRQLHKFRGWGIKSKRTLAEQLEKLKDAKFIEQTEPANRRRAARYMLLCLVPDRQKEDTNEK